MRVRSCIHTSMQALFSSRGLAQCTIDTSQPVGTVIQAGIEAMFQCSMFNARFSLQSAASRGLRKARQKVE